MTNFISPRRFEQEEKENDYRIFDKLADLALDGVITMDQLGDAYKTTLEDEERLWIPKDGTTF